MADGDDTYLVVRVSASLSRMVSQKYGNFTNVGVHIAFDSRPPKELMKDKTLVIGGTEFALSTASNAVPNDGRYFYSWYTALDYEPAWWTPFSTSEYVEVSVTSG